MAQFFEFIGNHWMLSSLWVALLLALILVRRQASGQSVSPAQAVTLINRSSAVVLDIRDKKEFDAGHIVDAVHIPITKLSSRTAELEKHKDAPIVVVCKLGQSSSDAIKVLKGAGFNHAVRMSGGMTEWRAQNLPLVQK